MNQSHKRFVYWVVLGLPTNFVFGLVSLDGGLLENFFCAIF